MRTYMINVRIAINGSLPPNRSTARRPQSRLAMQGQPWARSHKTETLFAARKNIRRMGATPFSGTVLSASSG